MESLLAVKEEPSLVLPDGSKVALKVDPKVRVRTYLADTGSRARVTVKSFRGSNGEPVLVVQLTLLDAPLIQPRKRRAIHDTVRWVKIGNPPSGDWLFHDGPDERIVGLPMIKSYPSNPARSDGDEVPLFV